MNENKCDPIEIIKERRERKWNIEEGICPYCDAEYECQHWVGQGWMKDKDVKKPDMRTREIFRRKTNEFRDFMKQICEKAKEGDPEATEILLKAFAMKIYSQEEIDKMEGKEDRL